MAEFGAESIFVNTNTNSPVVTKLDETHVAVAWLDFVDPKKTYAAVGVIDGNTVAWGSEYEFYGIQSDSHAIATLDNTHFVVVYSDGHTGYARIGEVSGNVISYGDQIIFEDTCANVYFVSVTGLDNTHFAVAYWGDGGNGTVKIGVVSGTTILEFGLPNEYSLNNCSYNKITALDSNHFVVIYSDGSDTKGYCVVGSVSGNTITGYGIIAEFDNNFTKYTAIDTLDNSHFIFTYQSTEGQPLYARMGTISGNSITYNAAVPYYTMMAAGTSVTVLDVNHFIAFTTEGFWSSKTYKGTIIGDVISFESGEVFFINQTPNAMVASLNTTNFIVVYNAGGPDRGAAKVWGEESVDNMAVSIIIF